MNTYSINQTAINWWTIPQSIQGWSFSINWVSLCGDGVSVLDFPDKGDNKYNLNIQDNPFIDGSNLLSRLLNQKSITIRVFVKKDTKAELNDFLDWFKEKMSIEEGVLTIPVELSTGTEVREIIVSQESISIITDKNRSNAVTIEMRFKATGTPRFYLREKVSKTYENITASFNGDINNSGTSKSYPEYYFVFWTVAWLNNIQITTDGYTIEIDQAITTNDVLIINTDVVWDGWFVTLNGTQVDYNWRLDVPLDTWSNIVNLTFAGWTFDVNLSVVYRKTYE